MKQVNVDVCVVGGGSAGVAAALSASANNSSVLLLEKNQSFGGQATNSWISAYCGFYTKGKEPQQVVFGVGEQVLAKLREHGQDTGYTISSAGNAGVRFRPEYVKIVLDELLSESKVDYRLDSIVVDAQVNNNKIDTITVYENGYLYQVKAKAFIDASGEANLAKLAGATLSWGNENGEVQQTSLSCLVTNIPFGYEIPMSVYNQAILEGKKANIPYLDKEKGMIIKKVEDDYGFLTIPSVSISDVGAQTITKSMIELRKKAFSYVETLKRFAPGFENIQLLATANTIGIRESYRIKGRETLSGEDVLLAKKSEESIGRGGWPAEFHGSKDLSYHEVKENDYFDIPANILYSAEFDNLFMAGRNVSCDSLALASLRVMGTAFATGQGAGVMASYYSINNNIDIKEVRNILKEQKVLL